jgi:hypothetical protein
MTYGGAEFGSVPRFASHAPLSRYAAFIRHLGAAGVYSRKCKHSFSSFRSRDAANALRAPVGPHKAAMVAAEGGKMRLLTYLELSRYSKPQLWELNHQMLAALSELPEGTEAHEYALMNVHHIRLFLARPDYALRL